MNILKKKSDVRQAKHLPGSFYVCLCCLFFFVRDKSVVLPQSSLCVCAWVHMCVHVREHCNYYMGKNTTFRI